MLNTYTVLVLEDYRPDVEWVQELLTEARLEVWQMVTASRLREAEQILLATSVDVILADLRLPDSEGVATLTRLRGMVQDIPIVALTSVDNDHWAVQAMSAGAQDYLVKDELSYPLLKRTLLLAIERCQRQTLQGQIETSLWQRLDERTVALRESETNFRQVVENISEVFFIRDLKTQQMVYVSPAYEKIWGRSCQSLYSQPETWIEAIHPDDRDRVLAHRDSGNAGKDGNSDYRILHPNGNLRWISAQTRVLFDSEGQPERLVGIAEDITLRKQTELALQRLNEELEKRVKQRTKLLLSAQQQLATSEKKFRLLVENIKDVFFLVAYDTGKMVYVSPRYETVWGRSCQSLYDKPKSWVEAIHPDDQGRVLEAMAQIFQSLEDFDEVFRIVRPDGETIWLRDYSSIIYDKAGQPAYIGGIAKDITHRITIEEQLKASVAEKEVLLQEVHHRVKNNLNVVYSLLRMQSQTIEDEGIRQVLFDSQRRIQTMALIHEQIYQAKNFATINYRDYLQQLVTNIATVSNQARHQVELIFEVEAVTLSLQTAIPCSLLVNELVTNAFKHGFRDHRSGWIKIRFYQDAEGDFHLSVSNNGANLPSDWCNRPQSLGAKLIHILTQQLRGSLRVSHQEVVSFDLKFPPENRAQVSIQQLH